MSITLPTKPSRVEKIVRKSLAVPLTEEELRAKTDQMVSDMTELERLETEFAALKKDKGAEIKEIKSGINKARKIVATGIETKLVEDVVQVFDIDQKRTWYEYREQQYENMAMSEYELRMYAKAPLFPDHEPADKPDDEVLVEEIPSNVSDIEQVRRSETQRLGKKDHMVGG